jgi:hypothetical protein
MRRLISVVTPTIRPEMLPIVCKCLKRQTFMNTNIGNFEWIVGAPQKLFISIDRQIGHECDFKFVPEPSKKEGDYYGLNKSWNSIFKIVQGELIVSIVDGLWFEPDLLERLWGHYLTNPKAIVGAIGHQYDQMINGKPEHQVWQDPRVRIDQGSFYETLPSEIEWCVASFPRQAIYDVGGVPEEYDRGAALSEKITNLRFEKAGYKLYLDQSLIYRAIHHPRLSKEWDEKYKIATDLYLKDVHDILEGKKIHLDYLSK